MKALKMFKTIDTYTDNYYRQTPFKIEIDREKAVKEHVIQTRMGKNSIRISTNTGFMSWVPVVDCDSKKFLIGSCRYLKERNYSYIIYESSSMGYWVLIDKIMRFGSCIKFMKSIYRQDLEYVSNCEYFDAITIRGFKKDIVPRKIAQSGNLSIEIRRFSAEVDLWFDSIYKN